MKGKIKLEELSAGDVIRGTFYDKNVRKRKREHCFIVLDSSRSTTDNVTHKTCVPACTFSSKPPTKEDLPYLDLRQFSLPEEFFKCKKKNNASYLRFSEPHCLKAFEVKQKIGNLKEYENLWSKICSLMNQTYPNEIHQLEKTCTCTCLEENSINVAYCEQDQIEGNGQCCAICSCCGNEMDEVEEFIKCPMCKDNTILTVVNETGVIINEFYEN